MKSKLSGFEKAIIIVSIIYLLLAALIYPRMPEVMASHWNAKGEVDGYSTKLVGVFLMPFISLIMAFGFILIPRIDPLKENIKSFRRYFDWFMALIFLFLLTIYVHSTLWNLGVEINVNLVVPMAIGILVFCSGVLFEHVKRNWFIGIRTPWTLSSDEVWDNTHKVGARLFKAAGIVSILGIFFGDFSIYLTLLAIIIASLYTLLYSFIEYQRVISQKS